MLPYKKIEIENCNEILQILQSTALEKLGELPKDSNFKSYAPKQFIESNPKLADWFYKNKLLAVDSAVVRIKPNNNSLPHIDTYSTKYILVFPVSNCTDTYTEIYELIEGTEIITEVAHTGHKFIRVPFGLPVLGRYSVTEPVILNSWIPHKIFNNTNSDRITVSFRFESDPKNLNFTS